MKLSTFFARRYFLAKSSSNAVNIITGISVLGILVGTAALIIVLAAFNGLEQLVRGFYADFDPDLKIVPAEGKFFAPKDLSAINWQDASVSAASFVLEEKALLTYQDRDYIATLKGVDSNWVDVTNITEKLRSGNYRLNSDQDITPALLGSGVAYFLRLGNNDLDKALRVFVPRDNQSLDPSRSFRSATVYPQGIFAIQPEFDEKYTLVPLTFVQDLVNRKGAVTALEVRLRDAQVIEDLEQQWQTALGEQFEVLNRDEQQAVFFKVMKTEGLFTFLVFALILSIATFTIAGSLTMLMFEKKENLQTLSALGMTIPDLRQIFFKEGMIICLSGGGIGLLLGLAIILLQQYFGLLAVGEGYVVEAYPVALAGKDILLVILTTVGLSSLVSWFTSRRLNAQMLSPQ